MATVCTSAVNAIKRQLGCIYIHRTWVCRQSEPRGQSIWHWTPNVVSSRCSRQVKGSRDIFRLPRPQTGRARTFTRGRQVPRACPTCSRDMLSGDPKYDHLSPVLGKWNQKLREHLPTTRGDPKRTASDVFSTRWLAGADACTDK